MWKEKAQTGRKWVIICPEEWDQIRDGCGQIVEGKDPDYGGK